MDSDRSDVSDRTEITDTSENTEGNNVDSKGSPTQGEDEKKLDNNLDGNQGKDGNEETETREEKKTKMARVVRVSRFSRLTKLGKQPMFRKRTKVEKEKEMDRNLKGPYPITAYAFFVKSFFVEYRRRNPDEKVNFVTLSRQCAEKWHELPHQIKQEFYKMAARANNRYAHIHNVKLQPKQFQAKYIQPKHDHPKYMQPRNIHSKQFHLTEVACEEKPRRGRPANKDKLKVAGNQHAKAVRIVDSKRPKFVNKGASSSYRVPKKLRENQSYKRVVSRKFKDKVTPRTANKVETKRSKGTLTEKTKKSTKGVNTPRLKDDNKSSSFRILSKKKGN